MLGSGPISAVQSFGHKLGMSESKFFSTFHLRLPISIHELLLANKGSNSLNTEIIERLERTLKPDAADQIANAIRPFLETLSDTDRARMADLASEAASIMAKAKPRRRSRAIRQD